MYTEISRGTALQENLKVAVAVAVAARKKDAHNSSDDWKDKAISARRALMKVSRCFLSATIVSQQRPDDQLDRLAGS